MSEHENCSQNQGLRISIKQNKSQSDEAVLKSRLCSSVSQSPSTTNMPLNNESSVSEELKCSSMSGILVTSSAEHLQFKAATQDVSLKEHHELEIAKQNYTSHYSTVEDEQFLRNSSSVSNKSAVLVDSPVRVRTIKCKLPNNIYTIRHSPDKQYRKVIHTLDSEVKRDGTSSVSIQPSTLIRQKGRLNNTTFMDPLADTEEKTVVIFLRESRCGNLLIDKIKNIIHDGYPNRGMSSSSNNETLSRKDPNSQGKKKSSTAQSEIARTDENARHDKYNLPHAHISKLRQAGDSLEHNSSKGVLSRGMESNLHNHINYLSDLQEQCHSNYNPAAAGKVKCDQVDGRYTNNDYFSTDKIRLMMQKEDGRVRCRKCGVTTTYRAFYKHAKKHFNIKPFKCGYCSYRSIEKSKVRVHNTFCHPNHPPVILKLSPESAGTDCKTPSACEVNFKEKNKNSGVLDIFDQVECKKLYKEDLRNISHNSNNISSLNAKPTAVNSSRQAVFQCPLCSKILQKHTPSIRRHLYSHYGYKPYKCGYCSYTGIGQSEVSFSLL